MQQGRELVRTLSHFFWFSILKITVKSPFGDTLAKIFCFLLGGKKNIV